MDNFKRLIDDTVKGYGISILEEEGEIGGVDGGGMDGEMPDATADPSMDASPDPETGASTSEPVYDKPYQDLAMLLYEALRIHFEDLEESQQRKILAVQPDDIKSDEQGVQIFKIFEAVLRDYKGPDVEDSVDPSGEGFGPGAR